MGETMVGMGFLSFILGIALLIVFFIMASNISGINRSVKSMETILKEWAKETGGYGLTYTCHYCKKQFVNKKEKCPHCGKELKYG